MIFMVHLHKLLKIFCLTVLFTGKYIGGGVAYEGIA